MTPHLHIEPRSEADDVALLGAYLGGTMTEEERTAFEDRVSEDEALFATLKPAIEFFVFAEPLPVELALRRNRDRAARRRLLFTGVWAKSVGALAAAAGIVGLVARALGPSLSGAGVIVAQRPTVYAVIWRATASADAPATDVSRATAATARSGNPAPLPSPRQVVAEVPPVTADSSQERDLEKTIGTLRARGAGQQRLETEVNRIALNTPLPPKLPAEVEIEKKLLNPPGFWATVQANIRGFFTGRPPR